MALEGPTNTIYPVNIKLDRAIFASHSVSMKSTPNIQLWTPGNSAAAELGLIFLPADWSINQIIKVSGPIQGTYPLTAVCTSTYYQRLGVLKEEESTINLTFIDSNDHGFSGGIAGVYRNDAVLGADDLASGSLICKFTTTTINKKVFIGKSGPFTVPSQNAVAARIVGPSGTTYVRGAQYVEFTAPTIGSYTITLYEQPLFLEIPGPYTSLPTNQWFFRFDNLTTSPIEDTTTTLNNGLVYRDVVTTNYGFGPLNQISHIFGTTIQAHFCQSLAREGAGVTSGGFIGSVTPLSNLECRANGYFTAPSASVSYNGPVGVLGVTVGGIPFSTGNSRGQIFLNNNSP